MLENNLTLLLALLPAVPDDNNPALLDGKTGVLRDELARLVTGKKGFDLWYDKTRQTKGKQIQTWSAKEPSADPVIKKVQTADFSTDQRKLLSLKK
jgi:hypothetical protein|eukprot:evm.model.NODE_26691_length_15112_cov_35.009068.4